MTQTKHPDCRKILIVDDNPDIHRDFASILDSSADTDALDQLEEEIYGSPNDERTYQRYHYRLFYATQGEQAHEIQEIWQGVAARDPGRIRPGSRRGAR